tara:strand:+ start:371 stop:568 length:198 start_codon:yes stop_codon:yes gene_type:complete
LPISIFPSLAFIDEYLTKFTLLPIIIFLNPVISTPLSRDILNPFFLKKLTIKIFLKTTPVAPGKC